MRKLLYYCIVSLWEGAWESCKTTHRLAKRVLPPPSANPDGQRRARYVPIKSQSEELRNTYVLHERSSAVRVDDHWHRAPQPWSRYKAVDAKGIGLPSIRYPQMLRV